jgi:multidrug efflux pump subunit AcrB
MQNHKKMGLSGRIAQHFLTAQITPLLALVAFLLGIFATVVTPREEEPQIDVTMANVMVPFPGASIADVEQMISIPAEQVLSQMQGVDHVMSVSREGMSVLTLQFKVGVSRNDALVRLHDTLRSNTDWLPNNLGVLEPIIKPKGIDDVPIVTFTLFSKSNHVNEVALTQVAHSVEIELKKVAGTREVETIGSRPRTIRVLLSPERMQNADVTVKDIQQALLSANLGKPIGDLLQLNQKIEIIAGDYFNDARQLSSLIIGTRDGRPIYLNDIAKVTDSDAPAQSYAWFGDTQSPNKSYSAVTLSVTKKAGANAIDVADQLQYRIHSLQNTIIPADVEVVEARNYGETANDKAKKLITKLLFATASVVALVYFALGRKEALIVGTAVVLTLTVTLFASWAWGFTLNRVSLFALIFSIGILVDDAIVVVENIHRHQQIYPGKSLLELIPQAVDEVGGPTILATLTVIAALLPMAFVSGLMGPYMSPIPINASMGMLLSLAVAFVVTPWLSNLWLGHEKHDTSQSRIQSAFSQIFNKVFNPLLNDITGKRNRRLLGFGVIVAIVISVLMPMIGWVHLKMLPFDNKSEFQVMVDMPAGTPLEKTAAVMHELSAQLLTEPVVKNVQAYVGTASPINFNGLVRQYYLRSGSEQGDIQVNLVDKSHRNQQSHAIATRIRPQLQTIARRFNATLKVVEVPPGPPVISPIVAEIYGPDSNGRKNLAASVKEIFDHTKGVVDTDSTLIAKTPRLHLIINRQKATMLGVTQASIVEALRVGLTSDAITYLHDQSKYPVPIVMTLPAERYGDFEGLLKFTVRSQSGKLIPIRELVTVENSLEDAPRYHKDLIPLELVIGDMAGKLDSPLYGMFSMRNSISKILAANGKVPKEYFIQQPEDTLRDYALKWDGEWQITFDTFRDMGAAYAVGLILIYLLVVAQFGSYLTPLIIMAPIPLTIIGVMPGHALLGSQFTATSMIGMIALAGIIVRNSILLVDFINLQINQGVPFKNAIVQSAVTRAQPIILTALAAMIGAFFILDDPIFNGLAISLVFGIVVSSALTLVVIPILYFVAYRNRLDLLTKGEIR